MNDVIEQRLWYVRRGDEISGPFPQNTLTQFMLLGRIGSSHQLSPDRRYWRPADEIRARWAARPGNPLGETDPERLRLARLRADERRGYDRRDRQKEEVIDEQRQSARERRRHENPRTVEYRQSKTTLFARAAAIPNRSRLILGSLLASLMAVSVLGVASMPRATVADLDCNSAPIGAVNMSYCEAPGWQAEGADLSGSRFYSTDLQGAVFTAARLQRSEYSYADLSAADLAYADLRNSRLTGAALRGAILQYADLRGADLSHADLRDAALGAADLRGARLDHALWPDGRRCAAGSLGICR